MNTYFFQFPLIQILFRRKIFSLFLFLIFFFSSCSQSVCLPQCSTGYLCKNGQCVLDSNGGREKAITCQGYCTKLLNCHATTDVATCTKHCEDPTTSDQERKQFLLRKFECFFSSTCREIQSYLRGTLLGDDLKKCVGCLTNEDCVGGYLCDTTKKQCHSTCQKSEHCKKGYRCFQFHCVEG